MQPQLFPDDASATIVSCESRSFDFSADQTWHLRAAGLEIGSAAVDVPLPASSVAVEIWLEPDGSSRFVSPDPIDRPVDAPHPSGCPG